MRGVVRFHRHIPLGKAVAMLTLLRPSAGTGVSELAIDVLFYLPSLSGCRESASSPT